MFRFLKDPQTESVATDFLLTLSPAVDRAYRLFIERAAQLCADIGFDSTKIATLLESTDTKFYFFIGVACEQMQASTNLLGSHQGKRLNKSITGQIASSGMPFGKRRTLQSIDMMVDNIELNPTNTRMAILVSILRLLGLMSSEVMNALETKAVVRQMGVGATIMEDGTGGIMRSILMKHGLIS